MDLTGYRQSSCSHIASDKGNGSFLLSRFGHTIFNNGAQDFSDTPCLRKAAARMMRRIAVEDLRDVTQAGFAQVG